MSEMTESIVILDACVLYPAPVRDILLSIAGVGLFEPKWTDEINEEWIRNLLKNRKDLRRQQLEMTVNAMDVAFRTAKVTNYEELIPKLKLPDKDDRHVLASAIKSNASKILTFNLKDFPSKSLSEYGVQAQSPDEFLTMLFKEKKDDFCLGVKKMIARLQNPPKSKSDVVATLIKCGLPQIAENIKKYC